jgi:hypothetical protein
MKFSRKKNVHVIYTKVVFQTVARFQKKSFSVLYFNVSNILRGGRKILNADLHLKLEIQRKKALVSFIKTNNVCHCTDCSLVYHINYYCRYTQIVYRGWEVCIGAVLRAGHGWSNQYWYCLYCSSAGRSSWPSWFKMTQILPSCDHAFLRSISIIIAQRIALPVWSK